jgi:hypothetical protein
MNGIELVNKYLEDIGRIRAPRLVEGSAVRTVAETTQFKVVRVLDFDGAVRPLDVEGYSFHMAKGQSDPLAFRVTLAGVGVFGPVYPGVTIRTPTKFTGAQVQRWESETSPVAGVFTQAGVECDGVFGTFVIGKSPEAEWRVDNGPGGFVHKRIMTQGYNVTTNVPGSNFDEGMEARGARSMKAAVYTTNGSNVSAGTIVWWWCPPNLSGWMQTNVQQPLVAGTQFACTEDLELPFQGGRYFPELRSFTQSSGSTAPDVEMFTYGEGGEEIG